MVVDTSVHLGRLARLRYRAPDAGNALLVPMPGGILEAPPDQIRAKRVKAGAEFT